MSTQTLQTSVNIEWDDGVVMVFSFDAPAGKMFCGFVHQVLALQVQSGSQTQVSAVLQVVQQQAIQISLDPQTWVETIKNAARGGKATIVFEDAISANYTTQTNRTFQLQLLFSVHG
jgi:hypothetical protein